MSFKFIITFFIGLGVYLAIMGVVVLVKYLRNKKKYKQELEVKKQEENSEVVNDGEEKQDNDNNA